MLNSDPKKLRFLGIDLHSRTRRRWMVVLTYLVYFCAMVLLAGATASIAIFQRYYMGFWLMAIASFVVTSYGIFREDGLVKRFGDPGRYRLSGMKGRMVMLRGLDDRAMYKHGDKFDDLSEERQKELLRTYKVGNYLFPAEKSMAPDRLDEREIAVRDDASRRTLRWLTGYCFIFAWVYMCRKSAIHPSDIAQTFLGIGVLMATGPKAIILWSEPDTRKIGDPQLVQQPLGPAIK